jgi:hypothetical protein
LVLQTLYAPVHGNARAKNWEWEGRGAGRRKGIGNFGIAFEMYIKKIPNKKSDTSKLFGIFDLGGDMTSHDARW